MEGEQESVAGKLKGEAWIASLHSCEEISKNRRKRGITSCMQEPTSDHDGVEDRGASRKHGRGWGRERVIAPIGNLRCRWAGIDGRFTCTQGSQSHRGC